MFSPSRFMACLSLVLLNLFSTAASADSVDGAAQALHLLDYVSADYPPTVVDGKVIDEAEYREQVEFLGALQGLIVALPARGERVELEQGVKALLAAVEQKQDGALVARQARQLGPNLQWLTK
jgi:high-affinity iron transporter